MATTYAHATGQSPAVPPDGRKRWTDDEFDRLIDTGLLSGGPDYFL
jgi:hypothetical protein